MRWQVYTGINEAGKDGYKEGNDKDRYPEKKVKSELSFSFTKKSFMQAISKM